MIIEGQPIPMATPGPESSDDDDEADEHSSTPRSRSKSLAEFRFRATDAAVLGKFLKAKRYKEHEAFTALRWRTDFRPADEDLAPPRDNACSRAAADKEGRPLCYSVLGREYQGNLMSMGQQGCHKYLRVRLLCVEKGIRRLNFRPGGVDSIVQIVDMRHAGRPTTKEMKLLIINEPSWYLTLKALKLRLVTKRSKNKFIFVKQSRVTETLVK
ncbi:hypothetical protein SASPL_156840 [Salvia splendens]|uniref:CRAL-TRIO domain-containing protein n=1 Tax=Salvia splendens TaxID=180675 RepID=A0A8X8VVZ3_SALSN|nr:hypothetical protein SASPL_156840 [Salvia splendens]